MENSYKDFLKLLRVYKHDFLNHLQVLSGYLQLKKPELALGYVREAIEEIQEHGSLMRLGLPEVAFWLLLKCLQLEEEGITLTIQNDSDFGELLTLENDLLCWIKSSVEIVEASLREAPLEQREWTIYFDGNGPFEIILYLPNPKINLWKSKLEPSFEILKMHKELCFEIEEDEKFLLKLIIPINK